MAYENASRIVVKANAQTLAVTITRADGTAASVYSDAARTTAATFPATITSETMYYVIPGAYSVSTLLSGTEIAGPNGAAVVVTLEEGQTAVVSPSLDYPTEIRANESGTFESVAVLTGTGIDPTGATSSAAAINAKLLALSAAGGGRAHLPAGTYKVTPQPVPGYPGYYACIQIPPNCHLTGATGATVVKLAANNAQTNSRIIGNTGLNGGDTNIVVRDLIVDGDGANQTVYGEGIAFLRARNIKLINVKVRNIFGDAAFPPGETSHFDVNQCVDVTYSYCQAEGTAGTQGSGFADNSSSNVAYFGCTSDGMSAGMGFASWHGAYISYSLCAARKNGTHGFNAEYGDHITYTGCVAGGKASDQAGGYFYANSQSLGNTASGFTVNATSRATLDACTSVGNGGNGLAVVSTGGTASSVRVLGGDLSGNTGSGVNFGDTACTYGSYISPATVIENNAWVFSLNGGPGNINWTADGRLSAPAMPASATAITNPYPCDVHIGISHVNTFFITLTGGSVINWAAPTVRLKPGGTISINYGSAPSWYWQRA